MTRTAGSRLETLSSANGFWKRKRKHPQLTYGPGIDIWPLDTLALGQSHRIRCPAGIRYPSALPPAKPEEGPSRGCPHHYFSPPPSLSRKQAKPCVSNRTPLTLERLTAPRCGTTQSWEKTGVNHKARDVRTKPRAHHSPITPGTRISWVIITTLKLLVTTTSRNTGGGKWNRFPTVKKQGETNAKPHLRHRANRAHGLHRRPDLVWGF